MSQHLYIGIMSGTSMDGVDAVLIRTNGSQWQCAEGHAFLPYTDSLKQELLELQHSGYDELHRSRLLAQKLSCLYADTVKLLLVQRKLSPADIRAVGCHGQTIRHAPEYGYSIQLADWALLAELCKISVIGDFRSRDLAAGGQGAPLVPAFHRALFASPDETRAVLNIGGIANISVLPPQAPEFGFDTGPGNMLMDAWVQRHWHQPYDKNGEKAAQGRILPELLDCLMQHPYFQLTPPKSTGRDLFSLEWLMPQIPNHTDAHDILRTLLEYTALTIHNALICFAPQARNIYLCGGGIQNSMLVERLKTLGKSAKLNYHSTETLNLNPQWVEAAAFGWLASLWYEQLPGNPANATGAAGPRILGACYPA